MSEQPGVDPRFPAVFQRGYAGGGETRVEARHDPGATSEGQAPVHGTIGTPPAAAPAAAPSEAVERELIEYEEPRRNPFITAASIMSAALTVGGAWLVYWANSSMNYGWSGDSVPVEVLIRQFGYMVGPSAVTAGLVGIVGLLFWHAAAWRRRAIAAQRHPEPR
ncbi:hypothetical protein [Salinibacterium sp. GXW1014]|uniref:hypothetical protein n=1 Tax=Salinibacterium sp. GXW1014 TaxID=3377838 RepID=UPI00383BE535